MPEPGKFVVKYLASSKDGGLWISIRGHKYRYQIDAAHHPWIKRMLLRQKNPGKVLAFIKTNATNCERMEDK